MSRRNRVGWGVGMALALAGCPVGGAERVFTAEIGPEGGELSGGGLTLTIPPGALSDTQTLTLRVDRDAGAAGLADGALGDGALLSPVYTFEPDGLAFAAVVEVEVAVDAADGVGTLLWSDPDTDGAYAAAGLAAGGVARGWTTHFSRAFVASTVCEIPTASTTECGCRADDEQADLLCPHDPGDSEGWCPDLRDYPGQDGMACTGWGPRPVYDSTCWCETGDGDYLCPNDIPLPEGLCDPGYSQFHGEAGEACSGWMLVYDDAGYAESVSSSGELVDCTVSTVDTTYQQLSGTLEGCEEVAAEAAAEPVCAVGSQDEDPSWSAACLDALAAGGADGCLAGEAAVAAAVAEVQQAFLAANADGERRYADVALPPTEESPECAALAVLPRYGRVDLLTALAPLDGPEVRVRISSLGPLALADLPLAAALVGPCTAERLRGAGARCALPANQLSDDERAFCAALEADGRPVVLAEDAGFAVDLDPLEVLLPHGDVAHVSALSCASGVTALRCDP